jgi:hypothetical protein
MSCCNRPVVTPVPRWPDRLAGDPAPPAEPPLRFTGRSALSLPLGRGRLLVQPGQVLLGLHADDHRRLRRTGLFEPA